MLSRLKKRRDFLAAAKGRKAARRAFVLETRQRDDDGPTRLGFTVSKRVAKKAVERNRVRRRLKEAARVVAGAHAQAGCDYVLVGRRNALTEPFADITYALRGAFRQSAEPRGGRGAADAPDASR